MADSGLGDVRWTASSFPAAGPFCDVVMKGGVTSGVVYPLAICRLASRYVFRSIGGASVGAVAAVLTGAAEYQRRRGSGAGYVALAELPKLLRRPGYLLALFRPDPAAKPLLDVALQFIGNGSFEAKVGRVALRFVRWYFWLVVLCFVAAAALAWYVAGDWRNWRFAVGAFVIGVALSVVTLPLRYLWHNFHVLNRSDFGWCHGHRATSAQSPLLADDPPAPLTDWLTTRIDQASGVSEREQPLSFGDLTGALTPGLAQGEPDTGIQLAMVTTCLTIGRPYRIPFSPEQTPDAADPDTDGDVDPRRKRPGFYLVLKELEPYFPARIINHLRTVAPISVKYSSSAIEYRRFPLGDDLPLVVAARMSLSFPVLLCAVPLYALDANGRLGRVWFSDGGLTSNFPVHFFDNPIPRWPTFAVDLLGGAPRKEKAEKHKHGYVSHAVFFEDTLPEGRVEPWDKIDKGYTHGNVIAFFGAIVDTIRTWHDVTLTALRANRQRTVGIRLAPAEGGLNLNMPGTAIEHLVTLGDQAGVEILRCFPGTESEAWKVHRWTRYRQSMHAYDGWLEAFARAYSPYGTQTPYDTLIRAQYACNPAAVAVQVNLSWPSQAAANGAASATEDLTSSKTRWTKASSVTPSFTVVPPPPFPPTALVLRPPL